MSITIADLPALCIYGMYVHVHYRMTYVVLHKKVSPFHKYFVKLMPSCLHVSKPFFTDFPCKRANERKGWRFSLRYYFVLSSWLKEVHGDGNATYKNLGTWAGPVMLLSDAYWGWTHIFRFWHFLLNNIFWNIFLKIKGDCLNDKKVYLLAFLYIRKFKKNQSFLGSQDTDKKKKRRE